MPIYAYKCDSCGQSKDVLQKMSDAPLTVCPFCGAEAFKKQVTAAGFQLKGSGWYVTDFRNGGSSAPATGAAATDAAKPASAGDAPAKSADAPATSPAPAAKSESAAPAAPAKPAAAPRAAD